jgi:hypothetical protein
LVFTLQQSRAEQSRAEQSRAEQQQENKSQPFVFLKTKGPLVAEPTKGLALLPFGLWFYQSSRKTSGANQRVGSATLWPLVLVFPGAGENQGLLQSSRKTSGANQRVGSATLWPLVFPAQGKTSRAIPKGLALLPKGPLVFTKQQQENKSQPFVFPSLGFHLAAAAAAAAAAGKQEPWVWLC